MWIVWNEARTEGFVTNDVQLAYEVRKSADTNCVTENGDPAPVAVAFCERWSQDNCTMEPIKLAAMRARLETREQELFQARDALHRLEKQRAVDIAVLTEQIDAYREQQRKVAELLGYADPDEWRT